MGSRVYTVLEMGVSAGENGETVKMKFTRTSDGNVEVVLGGRYSTVNIAGADANLLAEFLTTGSVLGVANET